MTRTAHAPRLVLHDAVDRRPRPTSTATETDAKSVRMSLLLCGLVTAVALLSFFVHVLENHVERGQRQSLAKGPAASQPQDLSQLLQPLQIGTAFSR